MTPKGIERLLPQAAYGISHNFTGEELPEPCSDERQYQKLWKQYFETIAIRERTNPRCQKTLMPVRYWKHLTEMK